jgi:hypothetical protein
VSLARWVLSSRSRYIAIRPLGERDLGAVERPAARRGLDHVTSLHDLLEAEVVREFAAPAVGRIRARRSLSLPLDLLQRQERVLRV